MSRLDEEIERTIAAFYGQHADPKKVLREFADRIGTPVERIKEVHSCPSCEQKEVICFTCKVGEVLGDQAAVAVPFLLPKFAAYLTEAAAKWRSRKQAEATEKRQNP